MVFEGRKVAPFSYNKSAHRRLLVSDIVQSSPILSYDVMSCYVMLYVMSPINQGV
jgi:hypothetical protein